MRAALGTVPAAGIAACPLPFEAELVGATPMLFTPGRLDTADPRVWEVRSVLPTPPPRSSNATSGPGTAP